MAGACTECEKLDGKLSSVAPHVGLKKIGRNKHRAYGMAVGVVEVYECLACGAELTRDLDSKDPGASWVIAKGRK